MIKKDEFMVVSWREVLVPLYHENIENNIENEDGKRNFDMKEMVRKKTRGVYFNNESIVNSVSYQQFCRFVEEFGAYFTKK